MKVRLKRDYKTKDHDHYLSKGTLIELYDNFKVFDLVYYNTNKGFRIACMNFEYMFVKVGD